jgi:hypothetical protein
MQFLDKVKISADQKGPGKGRMSASTYEVRQTFDQSRNQELNVAQLILNRELTEPWVRAASAERM